MKRFFILSLTVVLALSAWGDINFGTEEVVSTTTTWTFNDYTTSATISTCYQSNTKSQTDKLYNRSASSDRGFVFSDITPQAFTFNDGYSVNISKIASSSASYNTSNLNAKTAGTSGNESSPFFAFNASVPGTCYAYVRNTNASGKARIAFGVADGSTAIKASTTQSTEITEIKYTSTTAGVFFIGPVANYSIEIYAIRFVPSVYAPTFSQNGNTVTITAGTCNINGASVTTYYTTDESDPTTSSESFTGASADVELTANTTIKAVSITDGGISGAVASQSFSYTAPAVTITFNSAGGTDVTAITQLPGTEVSAPTAPTRDGYTFAGWYSGDDLYSFTTMPTENITLTAHWTAIDYTVQSSNHENGTVTFSKTGNDDYEVTITDAHIGETIYVKATANENYEFSSLTSSDVENLSSAATTSFTMPAKNVDITATFTQSTPAVTEISSVEIAGLVAPVKGEDLNTLSDLSTTTTGASISSITWDPTTTSAAASTAYTATIVLEASSGYQFASTVTTNDIAGKAATVKRTDDKHITVAYTFDETAAEPEASVNAEKTWTFDTLPVTNNKTAKEIILFDDAYVRCSSSPNREFTLSAFSDTQTLSFSDGFKMNVTNSNKYIYANGKMANPGSLTNDYTAASTITKTNSQSVEELIASGCFAFNASIPGTIFALMSNDEASKKLGIYFVNGTSKSTKDVTPTGTDISEICYSTTSSGSIFIGGTESKFKIYAVRFVPATTIKVPTGLTGGTVTADKASANEGEEVTLTVTPEDGYHLKEGELKAYYISTNGTETEVPITNNKFTKPAYYVYVKAEFEESTAPTITTAPTAATPTYTGEAQNLVTAGVVTGGTITYSTTQDGTYTEAIPQGTNAGDYTVWYKVTGGANHSDIAATEVTGVKINKATLTATADNKSKTVGEANPELTVTVTGFVNEENASTAAGYTAPTASTEATSASSSGEYAITVTGGSATNYTFNYVNGTLTVNSAGFSPTVSITGWTYGESAKTPSVEGNTSGGEVTYSYYTDSNLSVQTTTENSGAASDGAVPVNAGTYYVKATIAANGNYGEATVSTSFTIAKAAGSISYTTPSVDKTSTDGAFTNELTKTGDGTVNYSSSDTNVATVSETTGEVTIVGAGSTTITATVADGTNYSYETKTATYTLAVTTAAPTSIYGSYDFQTFAKNLTEGANQYAIGVDGNVLTGAFTNVSETITLNGAFSITGTDAKLRKYSNDSYNGIMIAGNKSATFTINNLKAGDWVRIDCNSSNNNGSYTALKFNDSNVYQLDSADVDVAGKAVVSGATYVVKADGTLPFIFGNANAQSYIYKVEIRNSEVVPAPVINFNEDTKKATITRYQSNKGNAATIYYTTDGNDPTTESSTYTDGTEIDVTSTMTIKAMSVANSIQSTIASRTVTGIEQTIAAPTIAVEGTTVTITQGTASDTSTEVKTYYTLDNSDPTMSSTAQEYTEPFILTATAYIKAYSKYNDAIGVSSEVTTYEKDGESKVRVGTFTAEENVFDFAAAAGDFQEISYAADATTVKYYYNAENTASEGNFYEITNTDYLTKSGNTAKILWREKGGEFSQANGGVMAKNGGQKYVAITELSAGQRVIVEFKTANLKYNTATDEGEATVDGETLTRGNKLTSGKEIVIASGSCIVFQVDASTVITKISILPAVRCNLGVTLDGILQWATYFAAENLAKPEGVKVYRVTSVTDNVVNTEEVNYIKAGVGVLLYSETAVDSEKLIVGTGYGSDYSSILLGSVETSTMNSGTNYVLYNNQFIPAEDNTLPANHCYLQIPGVSGTRSLTIEHGDDNTTGIHTTRKDQAEMENDKYYTLSGQRVEKPTKKGLYIKNGRKVVVK